MAEIWFGIAAGMLVLYVVLDGYDFGAGALHLFVARSDPERRQVALMTLNERLGRLWKKATAEGDTPERMQARRLLRVMAAGAGERKQSRPPAPEPDKPGWMPGHDK